MICILKAYSQEFTIPYNEGTDKPYSITYRCIEDAIGTVEISRVDFPDYYIGTVDVVNIPGTIVIDGKSYVVTTINNDVWGTRSYGPRKIVFPSTIRWIKSSIWAPLVEEIIFDNSPLEELYYIDSFRSNRNLRHISFGDACLLSELPYGCFQYCSSLTEVQLPKSLKNIGKFAFDGCTSLKSISLPSSLEYMDCAFIDCTSLEEVIYKGTSLWNIGDEAFKNCTSLKSISLPSVCKIGNRAFLNCKSLNSVTICTRYNENIRIESHAFDNCINLNDLKYEPNSLQYIGEAAFNNCSSLRSFALPSEGLSIDVRAFAGCTGLEKFEVEVSGWQMKFSVIDGVLIRNRNELMAYPAGKKDISYSVPDVVTSIASGAFEGAVHLEDINFHDHLENFGVMAFRDCKALRSIKMPESLNHVPSGTFSGCSSLESVGIPDKYVYIGASSFKDCSSLLEVKLPSDLQVIGESAFVNCSKMENVSLPTNVKEIRANTFRNCESMKTITLPENLDTIHFGALQGCKALRNIELPESLKGIEQRAFKGCESLESLTIPDNVGGIGINAFEECTSLKEVIVGNGVKEIGQWAFYDCVAMEKLKLGSALESIGAQAFDGDVNIKEITCLSPQPPSFPGGFPEEVMENAFVYVPEGSEDAYNSSPEWDPMVVGEVQKAELIELNHTEIELFPKESITLIAVVLPDDAVDRSVTWSSSDYYVAKVDENGVVRGAAVGSAVITATASNGVSATCRVTVKDDSGDVSSINLDSSSIFDIYNLEGILLRTNADIEYWKALPKGLYIIRTDNGMYKMKK